MKRSIRSSSLLCDEKNRLRIKKIKQIESLEENYIRESDGAIVRKLCGLSQVKNAKTVFLYYSVGREISTHGLIRQLLAEGKRVALPVSGDNGEMKFYLADEISRLCLGRFGIPEPPETTPVTPGGSDVIIVPALCCDRYGNRLGHGMGYYDRYLAENPAFSICLCRKQLLEEKLPTEDTDVAVSLVLTD